MPHSKQTKHTPSLPNIPPGFTAFKTPDGRETIVPTVVLPHFHEAFAAYQTKRDNNVVSAKPRLAQAEGKGSNEVVGGLFNFPSNLMLSNQEKLALHSEVQALQTHLGISYKDASHRLYMAELEKLKLVDKNAKAWANVSKSIRESIEDISRKEGEKPDDAEGDEQRRVRNDAEGENDAE